MGWLIIRSGLLEGLRLFLYVGLIGLSICIFSYVCGSFIEVLGLILGV